MSGTQMTVTKVDSGLVLETMAEVLQAGGVETYQHIQGSSEPTIQFHGDHSEGFRALAWAIQNGLPVIDLRRVWSVQDGEPTGPTWEMTFGLPTDEAGRARLHDRLNQLLVWFRSNEDLRAGRARQVTAQQLVEEYQLDG